MYMYEDWMESKGTTELLSSKAREGGPWLCEVLVFNSFVGCISPGSYGLLMIASSHQSFFSFSFSFFVTKNWRGIWVLRNKIMRKVQYFVLFFRFNCDLIVWFLWRFAGLRSVPYWRSYHGYQQKKSCCIKHQMRIVGEAGRLSLMDFLLWM